MADRTAGFPEELATRFEPHRRLGAGAMGAVWLARDRSLDRLVAIKILKHFGRPDLQQRFDREARILGALDDPHVLKIYASGVTAFGPYLVMEYLDGGSPPRPIPAPEAAAIMRDVARGLQAAHDRGVLHRDLKPDNIMRTREGRTVVVDFGLARDEASSTLTAEGGYVGSPGYLAPECWRGERASTASDWYGWGATWFHLVEGRMPFEAPTLIAASQGATLPRPRFDVLPEGSRAVEAIAAALADDPARRPKDLAAALALMGDEGLARPPTLTAELAAPTRPGPGPGPGPGTGTGTGTGTGRGPALSGGHPPVPGPGVRRWGPALGVALLAAGLGAGLLARGRPEAPAGAGEAAPPASAPVPDAAGAGPASPFPPGWVESIVAWVAARAGEVVGPDGKVTASPEGGVPAGGRRRLDPDPAAWGELLGAWPELGVWDRWIAGGGDPAGLAEETVDALASIDAELVGRDLPRVFAPALGTRRPAGEVATPAGLREGLYASYRFAPSLRGWGAALGTAWAEVVARHDAAEAGMRAALRGEPGAPALPTRMLGLVAMPQDLLMADYLGGAVADRGNRLLVAPWIRPASEALGRFLFVAGRALREDPADADRLALVVVRTLAHRDGLWFDGPTLGPPARLLGLEAATPAEKLLLGLVAEAAAQVRLRMGLAGRGELEELAAAAYRGACPAWVEGGGFGELRVLVGLERFVELQAARGKAEAVFEAFHLFKEKLYLEDGGNAGAVLGRVAELWAAGRAPAGWDPEDLAMLLTWLDAHPESWGSRKTRAKVRESLDTLYRELER